jgi:hypothetical protein
MAEEHGRGPSCQEEWGIPRFKDAAKELDSRSCLPAERLALLVVGSMAQGWANEDSDLDMYVVTSELWSGSRARVAVPLDTDFVSAEVQYVEGRRCEIKYWLDSQVDQMLAHVTWEEFEQPSQAAKILHVLEESFLERLVTCVPVEGEAWVRRRREQLQRSAFKALLVTRSLANSDGCCEDALGQLAAGDLHSAVLSARQALGFSVDGLLESAGCFGSHNPKWRARRFRAVAPPQMRFEDYWCLETMRTFDPKDPERWVIDVVRTCKNLHTLVEI